LQITIHRGSREIGGTCIELATRQSRILLDLGEPLHPDSRPLDPAALQPDAVLVSHPHQDHYGLIDKLDPQVPVYIGALGKALIDATRVFLDRPRPGNSFRHFSGREPFVIGDFTVTPWLVDHSAADAYAFLIEAQGQRLFYSGDFRSHGRKQVLFERLLQHPPRDIDLLFMEGTMMRRDNSEFPSEQQVEQRLVECLAQQENMAFLIASSQNIDRLVSAYRACLASGKTLVVDAYTAWVLELMGRVSRRMPAMHWPQLQVYVSSGQYETLKRYRDDYFKSFVSRIWHHRITKEELEARPADYLFFAKMSHFRRMRRFKAFGRLSLIYSQWLGYLDYANDAYYGAEEIAALRDDPEVDFVYAHTSGHAPLPDLQRLARALAPRALVPIHTEYADDYGDHFANIVRVDDDVPFSLG